MRTNGDFGKFLYELKPQSNQGLLAFYNYIRLFTDLSAPFLPETVSNFYIKALSFEHWQKNSLELSQTTHNALFKFLGQDIDSKAWQNLKKPELVQIIKIKNYRDQLEVIKQYLPQNLNSQIFADKNNIAHAVLALPQGRIRVQTFDNLGYIQNGRILPLVQDRILDYDKNLELIPNRRQQLQISSFVTAHFTIRKDAIKDEMIVGNYIRGYTFQSFQKIELHGFHQDSNILYSLKKIERFFIDRSTEPLYVELVEVLEQTLDFLRRDLTGSLELGKKAYIRGQNALENVFVDDKMLAVLLNEIQSFLAQSNKESTWNQRTSSESINTSLNPVSVREEPPIN